MRLTDRDMQIIVFIKVCGVVDTETICKMYFDGGLRTCQIRLKKLVDNKYLKKIERETFLDQNVFYINKKPKQIKHKLLFSKFVAELQSLGAEILKIRSPLKINNVIADGFIAYKLNNENKILLVEIELTKYFNLKKYEELYYSRKWKEMFPVFPCIAVVTDKTVEKSSAFTVIDIKTDFSDIKNIYFN